MAVGYVIIQSLERLPFGHADASMIPSETRALSYADASNLRITSPNQAPQ